MMIVGGGCVVVQWIIHTIPTVGNLRGVSFLFPPEPIGAKLLKVVVNKCSVESTRMPSQFWQHNTRLDKTREQRLQDALVNVGSSDFRETSLTASCWIALAPQERDEAMMLSQLTFHESENLTKAGAAREEST